MKVLPNLFAFSLLLAACTSNSAAVSATAALPNPAVEAQHQSNHKNATYQIEGQAVTLVDGLSEMDFAPGSAGKLVTRYFGNEAIADLNGDGYDDVAFLLTQNSGGSGTFFYVVVALQSGSAYLGTNAVMLGDRIAPQTTGIENGVVIVNYADRNPGEPFSIQPSLGVSKYLKVVETTLVETSGP